MSAGSGASNCIRSPRRRVRDRQSMGVQRLALEQRLRSDVARLLPYRARFCRAGSIPIR